MEEQYIGSLEFNISALGSEQNANRRPFIPDENDYFSPFPIHDPFNLRKAVVPVFATNSDMNTYGMGTAFSIDCQGSFMTAEHVIESLRGEKLKISMSLLLGYGLVFGTVPIPDECFAQIESIEYFGIEKDDPLKIINGNINAMTPLDIAHLNAHILPQAPAQLHLGLNKLSWTPKVGDAVLAIGYPELECKLLKEQDQRQLLTEGMYGAFGIIREVHPQGTNSTHPTPVFEVDGIWPPGMSGGPVFNSNGEVIGIVSRSMLPENDGPGIGFAACLYLLPVFK